MLAMMPEQLKEFAANDNFVRSNSNPAFAGRFGYTGQVEFPELGLSNYKARMYSAALGRFLQPDPIGYAGGMNQYAYVGGDPVNFVDPLGLEPCIPNGDPERGTIRACGTVDRCPDGACMSYDDYNRRYGNEDYGSDRYEVAQLGAPNQNQNQCASHGGPRGPDFATFNYEFGLSKLHPKLSFGGGITVDRFNRFYFHAGGSGNSTTGDSVSFTESYKLQNGSPTPEQLESYLTGYANSVTVGDGLAGTAGHNSSGSSIGGGIGIGASVSRSRAGERARNSFMTPACAR